MTLQPVQMIGSAITPVTLGAGSATPASSSSGTVGRSAGSGLSSLGQYAGLAAPASSGSTATGTMGMPTNNSGASGVSPGAVVGAAKLGGSLTGCSTISTAAGLAGNALAIYNGVKQGGVMGDTGAALAGVTAANKVDSLATGSGFLSTGAAAGVGAAGIVIGIKQGGIMGYGSAALNAAQLYNNVNTAVNAYEGTSAAATGATAAAGEESGAALGLGASAGLVSVADAPFLYGESKPGIQLSSTTWGNINDAIKAGIGGYSSGATAQQVLTAAQQLQGLQNGILNPANPSDISGGDPQAILAGMKQYGITDVSQIQPLVEQLLNSIPEGAMPGQAAGEQSAHGGDLGVASGKINSQTKAY